MDADNKNVRTWNERNVYPSEPIFVPAPNAKVYFIITYHRFDWKSIWLQLSFSFQSEDDGVILSAMVWGNGDANRVGLLVLCAKTMSELGRCEFLTPGPIPKCLHGWFAPKWINDRFKLLHFLFTFIWLLLWCVLLEGAMMTLRR